ncbi:methyltransferase domain-containing protein [Saccharopolyspora sp. HNM0983]|uniref:Methyltransferase domain-containing protein n=1 Tax=Saccharopolyspora montiporae TaxID=2781240 RepID=A0A929G0K4_9PSEU|nr:methyltransferase domain-containing protein [Saccharopolyspora sp. HNM0983]
MDVNTAADYAFARDGGAAARRHALLAEAYDPVTLDRLAETGVGSGWQCLEVGAGAGTVSVWLAERVAPSGEVLATDVRRPVLPRMPGLRGQVHDAVTDPLPEAAFDLVVARLVLRHLPQRAQVLDGLVRALKPGGWLQIDEFDTSYEPPLLVDDAADRRVFESFLAAKDIAMRARGVDPSFGRHAAGAMRDAGLVEVDPRPRVQLRHPGSADLALLAENVTDMRDSLREAGMSEHELDRVRDLFAAPGFRACSSLLYSVHGRKAAR